MTIGFQSQSITVGDIRIKIAKFKLLSKKLFRKSAYKQMSELFTMSTEAVLYQETGTLSKRKNSIALKYHKSQCSAQLQK